MSETETFGGWLMSRRRALGLTREELALRANCAPITVEKIERGRRKPSEQVAHLLLSALQIPAHQHEHLLSFIRGEINASELERALQGSHPPRSVVRLPVPLTPLLGREREVVEAVRILLRPDVRLLTLSGPGGVGKTRLALRVAEDVAENFPDGVYFVPLAPISDPNLVAPTITRDVGLKEAPEGMPLESLKRGLRDHRALLLVDNFEQVISASPLLSELLSWCPGVKALVTSREALRLSGEHQMSVPPLALPSADDETFVVLRPSMSLRTLVHTYASLRLFVERAQAVSDFEFTEENVPDVAEICRRLDGLPLAIELAAARIPLLSPAEILTRLARRLPLLTDGARDLPDRHRTLDAAIAWSYDLLDEGEQRLFGRISVFVGSCTVEAVEAVCNAHADLPMSVMHGVASLLDKSLLNIERGVRQGDGGSRSGDRRFTMLETIREYALERLVESGEWDGLRAYHTDYFLALVEAARPEYHTPRREEWLGTLEREHNNLRAALRWALERGEVERALRLAGALARFWYERGHLVEGLQWLEAALEQSSNALTSAPISPAISALALQEAVMLTLAQGDMARAKVLSEKALALHEELGDKRKIAVEYSNLGAIASEEGDYPQALSLFEKSLALWRELGDLPNSAVLLANMGFLAIHQGDYERAILLCGESLDIQRSQKRAWGIVAAQINLGLALLHQGDSGRALSQLGEALAVARETGDKRHVAQALVYLGLVALQRGEYAQAAVCYQESLTLSRELGNKFSIYRTLVGSVGLAVAQGDVERAALLLGATGALSSETSMKLTPTEEDLRSRAVEAVRSQLEEAAYLRALAAGKAMTLEEVAAMV